jgi:hypothetical protein
MISWSREYFSRILWISLLLFPQSFNVMAGPRMLMTGKALPITRIGSATGTTTAAIPAHLPGDLIVIFAFRSGNTTAPSLGAGYTSVGTKAGTTCGSRVGYKIATSTSDTSGTWTNASQVVAVVYRGNGKKIQIGNSVSNKGTTNTLNYAAQTLMETNGTSVVTGFVGHMSTDQNLTTPPAGMTNFASIVGTASAASADTTYGVKTWPSTNVTLTGTASSWISWIIEIVNPIQYPGGWDIQNIFGISQGGTLPTNYTFSNGDRTLLQLTANNEDVSSVDMCTTGKKYVEASFDAVTGTSGSFGTWSTSGGYTYWDLISGSIGVNSADPAITGWTFGSGTLIGEAIDIDNGLVWFKNISTGSNWNNNAAANPATGTGGLSFTAGGQVYLDFGGSDGLQQITVNTGKISFTGTVPIGFSAWAP